MAPQLFVAKSELSFLRSALLQCQQFPGRNNMLSPAWGRMRLSGEHLSVPAWACLPQSLPWAFASSLPGTFASVLPGHVLQWDTLPVPGLETFENALPRHVWQSMPGMLDSSLPAWQRLFVEQQFPAELFSNAYRTRGNRNSSKCC